MLTCYCELHITCHSFLSVGDRACVGPAICHGHTAELNSGQYEVYSLQYKVFRADRDEGGVGDGHSIAQPSDSDLWPAVAQTHQLSCLHLLQESVAGDGKQTHSRQC